MSSLFLEAESFRTHGGWVVDPSAMHKMGSAYLMAHGAGVPVADAETSIEITEPGDYTVRARTRDWTAVWKRGTPAGRFTLKIDGVELPQVLGTNGEKWAWQTAGKLFLSAGRNAARLPAWDTRLPTARKPASARSAAHLPMRLRTILALR